MRNINKYLTGFALVATLFASGQTLYATNINQEIVELKMRYEDAYHRYNNALKEGVSATTRDLARQVEQAKAKYEEAKRRLTLSDETKENLKNGYESVKETVTDTFAYGTGNTTDTSTDNRDGGKSLSQFDNYSVNIQGNNFCGQFSTAMIFQYYGINKDGNKIYSETNPGGIFTAPSTLVEYLNLNGLDANEKNNASIQDLIKKLNENTPVQCLVSTKWHCTLGCSLWLRN